MNVFGREENFNDQHRELHAGERSWGGGKIYSADRERERPLTTNLTIVSNSNQIIRHVINWCAPATNSVNVDEAQEWTDNTAPAGQALYKVVEE